MSGSSLSSLLLTSMRGSTAALLLSVGGAVLPGSAMAQQAEIKTELSVADRIGLLNALGIEFSCNYPKSKACSNRIEAAARDAMAQNAGGEESAAERAILEAWLQSVEQEAANTTNSAAETTVDGAGEGEATLEADNTAGASAGDNEESNDGVEDPITSGLELPVIEGTDNGEGTSGVVGNADIEPKTIEVESDAEAEQSSEGNKPSMAAANAEGGAGKVTSEVITEDNSRSSNEEAAVAAEGATGDNDSAERMLKILGAAGAGIILGEVLGNGDAVVSSEGDRVVVRRNGELIVRKDENELLRRPGSEVTTEEFADGSTRTVVTRKNGARIVTIRDGNGYTVRRTRIRPDGREVVLFDDAEAEQEISREELDRIAVETENSVEFRDGIETAELAAALRREQAFERRYTLRQIRETEELRNAVARIDLDAINFETGSAAITPDEARDLGALGVAIREMIEERPGEVFLIEGHTDAVGSDVSNLSLSDRRAEAVALALTEYFDVPPENLVVQGYGERFLKVRTDGPERANRRATVRRITPLLTAAAGSSR